MGLAGTRDIPQRTDTVAVVVGEGNALVPPGTKCHAKNPCPASHPCQTFQTIQKDIPSGTGGCGGRPLQFP